MLLALAVRLVEEGVERHEGEDGVHAWVGLGLGLGLGLALGLGLGLDLRRAQEALERVHNERGRVDDLLRDRVS